MFRLVSMFLVCLAVFLLAMTANACPPVGVPANVGVAVAPAYGMAAAVAAPVYSTAAAVMPGVVLAQPFVAATPVVANYGVGVANYGVGTAVVGAPVCVGNQNVSVRQGHHFGGRRRGSFRSRTVIRSR